MLCFLFAALIVALDQIFKHWVVRYWEVQNLTIGDTGPEIIPGVLGLTLWENDGAMLNILSGQQWLLAGIAFCAAIVLVMILLRYNEGFWGTLGLASVLGGTVGNLFDRLFNDGRVIDMFRTLFINFPIFNFADIFITLGFLTFLIHFIALSFKTAKNEADHGDIDYDDYEDYEEHEELTYDEFPEIDANVSAQAEQDVAAMPVQYAQEPQYTADATQSLNIQPPMVAPPPREVQRHVSPAYEMPDNYDYDLITDTTPDTGYSLDELEAELDSLEDYNVEDILREYGFDDD